MDDYVANFPEDIVNEILLRCPVKSMLRFKCVCKNWYVLIKTPDFVQQHLKKNRRPPNRLIYDYDNGDDDDDYCGPMTLISEENFQTFLGMQYLIGYVDGLFLMYGQINSAISCALWNPATREVRSLHFPSPIMDSPIFEYSPNFGLGIDLLTNDYKAVYFLDYEAAVYSCRRDSWRVFKIEDFDKPPPFDKEVRRTYGTAYLNGNYYWLLINNNISTILLFNFGREMFEEIEGPDLDSSEHPLVFHYGMMLFDDSIAILNTSSKVEKRFYYDIWVMIQPGVWNRLITFQCFPVIISCYDSSLIFVTRASRLFSYNVRTNKTRHLGFHYSRLKDGATYGDGGCGVYYYKESLIPIKQQELDH
ncbi:F-box protein At3g08750-like [Solanum stenotomum]|uniref:F-box protein At3g08750-like n=1 Tax=Solanum stenotomum TaxID=172797 RepID=UPI0020D0BA0E|nr:F-box protein At3g08750-like [Solanum stenotomum]